MFPLHTVADAGSAAYAAPLPVKMLVAGDGEVIDVFPHALPEEVDKLVQYVFHQHSHPVDQPMYSPGSALCGSALTISSTGILAR